MHHRFALVASVVATMTACTSKAPPTQSMTSSESSSASPLAAATEAPQPRASAAIAIAKHDGPFPALSGSAPPPPSAKPAMNPRAAALTKELDKLDIAMLGTLNGPPSGQNPTTITDSVDVAGSLDRVSQAGRGSGGDLRIGGGTSNPGRGGIATLSGSSTSARIHGKRIDDARADDVKAALEQAGCTVVPRDDAKPSAGATFDAACPEHHLVTFFAAGGTLPDAAAVAELERGSVVFHDGGAVLVIHPAAADDVAKARRLLDKITEQGASVPAVVAVGPATVAGGAVANASAVVAGMAAGFRRCYRKGLEEAPDAKGTVRVVATLDADGAVTRAAPEGGGTLPGTVISCIAARVAAAQFAPPDGGSATITIPVKLSPTAGN